MKRLFKSLNPVSIVLYFAIPAVTTFVTMCIVFFPVALVSDYTVMTLFESKLGLLIWVLMWILQQYTLTEYFCNYKNR